MDETPSVGLEQLKAETESLLKKAKDTVDRADIKIKENKKDNPPTAQTADEKLQNVQELKAVQEDLEKSEAKLTQQRDVITTEIDKTELELTEVRSNLTAKQAELQNATDDTVKEALQEEITQLSEKRDQLTDMKEQLTDLRDKTDEALQQVKDRTEPINQLVIKVEADINDKPEIVNKQSKHTGRILAAPIRMGIRTARYTVRKVNPLEQNINKRETSDHGVESLRLAYRTGTKIVSTAKTTVKIAKSPVKAVKAIKKAPRVIANTAKRTAKVTAKTARIMANIVVHIAAALINPVTWVILFFAMVVYVILSIVVIIMGGASTQDATQAISYTQQVGIDDTDMDDAREYYRIACDRNKGNFSAVINGLYYSASDLRRSDLVYMERSEVGTVTQYTKGFATPTWKASLINAWLISVPEQEAIAIAYVYLQMQENSTHGTQQQIYQITYTQDIFNQIVDAAVRWSDTTYDNQQCAQNNCSEHHDSQPNPAYATAQQALTDAITRRDDWSIMVVPRCNDYAAALAVYNNTPAAGQSYAWQQVQNKYAVYEQAVNNWSTVFGRWGLYIDENLGASMLSQLNSEVSTAQTTLNNTDQYTVTTYYTCDHLHTLHSIGLYTYDKDTVMTALGFTDADKQWENLIELGMNLDLTGGA